MRDVRDHGTPVALRVIEGGSGSAAHALAEAAEEERVDLIAAGTRGITRLRCLTLGSVTRRLLHIAHCPALVVPTDA